MIGPSFLVGLFGGRTLLLQAFLEARARLRFALA
jgi:hypothetical protein